jgi:hypothetical protein
MTITTTNPIGVFTTPERNTGVLNGNITYITNMIKTAVSKGDKELVKSLNFIGI